MHAPDFRDKRLAGETIRRLDAFAAVEESGTDSAALAAALVDELADLSPFRFRTLERAVRDAYRYAPYRAGRHEPSLAARVKGLFVAPKAPPRLPPSPIGRWLRMMHPNGYVREEVLTAIDEPPPGAVFLVAVLQALNDHVPQVRAAAEQCLVRVRDQISDAVITAAVPYLVTRRASWKEPGDRQAIAALLDREGVRDAIRTLLTTSPAAWLPRFFRDLLALEIADTWLAGLATEARHPAIRARSTLVLVEGKVDRILEYQGLWRDPLRNQVRIVDADFDLGRLIATNARDRTVIVRKAAAEGLVRHYRTLPDVAQQLAAFGDEKNAVIRHRLDFVRRQLTGA